MIRNQAEQLRSLYHEYLGIMMPRATLRQLLLCLIEGTPWEYYEYALEEAAVAPRPSWRYALAIVARLKAGQVPVDQIREKQRPRERVYTHTDEAADALMAMMADENPTGS